MKERKDRCKKERNRTKFIPSSISSFLSIPGPPLHLSDASSLSNAPPLSGPSRCGSGRRRNSGGDGRQLRHHQDDATTQRRGAAQRGGGARWRGGGRRGEEEERGVEEEGGGQVLLFLHLPHILLLSPAASQNAFHQPPERTQCILVSVLSTLLSLQFVFIFLFHSKHPGCSSVFDHTGRLPLASSVTQGSAVSPMFGKNE